MGYFKYELERGGGSMYIPDDLTWTQRLLYRLRGYKVTQLTDEWWAKQRAKYNTAQKTMVHLEINSDIMEILG